MAKIIGITFLALTMSGLPEAAQARLHCIQRCHTGRDGYQYCSPVCWNE